MIYKQKTFAESRKRKRGTNNNQFPKVKVHSVVNWIDQALLEIRREKQGMIRKAFRVTGICPLLEGETLHDYSYVE